MTEYINRCPACLGGPLPKKFPVCENCRLGSVDVIKTQTKKPGYEFVGVKPSSIDARRARNLARMSQEEKDFLGVEV